jgi:hypothetical protein
MITGSPRAPFFSRFCLSSLWGSVRSFLPDDDGSAAGAQRLGFSGRPTHVPEAVDPTAGPSTPADSITMPPPTATVLPGGAAVPGAACCLFALSQLVRGRAGAGSYR